MSEKIEAGQIRRTAGGSLFLVVGVSADTTRDGATRCLWITCYDTDDNYNSERHYPVLSEQKTIVENSTFVADFTRVLYDINKILAKEYRE